MTSRWWVVRVPRAIRLPTLRCPDIEGAAERTAANLNY